MVRSSRRLGRVFQSALAGLYGSLCKASFGLGMGGCDSSRRPATNSGSIPGSEIPILKIVSLLRTLSGHTNRIFACCAARGLIVNSGTASPSLDHPLTHAVTFTDLPAAFVKNILSLSRVSFVLFRKPVLLPVRDALLQSLPLR